MTDEVVIQINDGWRVVNHSNRAQWVLEAKGRKPDSGWYAMGFCRTRIGLLGLAHERINERRRTVDLDSRILRYESIIHIPDEAMAALRALPEFYPEEKTHGESEG